MVHRCGWAAALLMAGCLAGCGSDGPAKDYVFNPGKGVIEGVAPENATITFIPVEDSSFVSRGEIREGKFDLTTHFSKPAKSTAGIPVGQFRVRINIPNSTKEIAPPALPETVEVKGAETPIKIPVKKS
jgi:hypothetical protein